MDPTSSLISWRHALFTTLGLAAACSSGGSTDIDSLIRDGGTTGGGGPGGGASTGGSGGSGGAATGGGGTVAPGIVHRAAPAECTTSVPRPDSQIPAGWDAGSGSFACELDADCTERAHGYCLFQQDAGFGDFARTTCSYGCASDADCSAGRVCDCGGVANRCVLAGCITDADCGAGALCLRTDFNDGCGARIQYRCQTAADTCAQDADCPAGEGCAFLDTEGHHACQGQTCAVGRPFLVRGAARRAPACETAEWAIGFEPCTPLPPERAAIVAARWAEIGLMEHASIAAFARFAMQLLALGAPPDLVSAATEAMADETRHAQIAFGLAARYGGRAVGPGQLSMVGALAEEGLERVLLMVVLEACCGETVAAHEAQAAADVAGESDVREALAGIAADERRHAELGWRFVRWALGGRGDLGALALHAVEQELAQARAKTPPATRDGWMSRHGILTDARRHALRLEALEVLVAPCMRALCATPSLAA
jgi:hypothetical protein